MLAHANHAQFLIRKLWAEFIASPIPQGTLDNLVAAYRASGFKLKPLIRSILANPLIFESLDEPNLIKPPMVYIVGALRQFDAPLKHNQIEAAMNATQQKVYFPPNVSGWEGGLSWLNTNTVQARFDLDRPPAEPQVLQLLHGRRRAAVNYPDALLPAHVIRRRADAQVWYDRALETLNYPWVSAGDQATALALAGTTHRRRPPRRAPPAAALRTSSADSRRPRRTGDVTCAASNAKRSSSRGSATSGSGRPCRSRTPRSTASRPAARRRT